MDAEFPTPSPVVYETHLHTPLCHHATGELEEYAAAAQRRNLKGIIVTCHNALPNGYSESGRMRPDEFPDYLSRFERARLLWQDRIDVRLGLECDYVVGYEDFLARQAASAPFDYLLGSVHPHLDEYLDRYWRGDVLEFQRTYYDHLAMAAELRLFDCISHPDVVKNMCPEDWNVKRLLPDIQRALDRIARVGCAMELNTSGLLKEIPEMNPGRAILREMQARDIPVVVGGDAHHPDAVAWQYEAAYDLLKDVGYRHVSYFLEHRQYDIPIDEARQSLVAREVEAR